MKDNRDAPSTLAGNPDGARVVSHRARPEFSRLDARLLGVVLMCAGLLPWLGCRLVHTTASVPQRTVEIFMPGGRENPPPPGGLQQRLMRFADEYNGRTIVHVDELMALPEPPWSEREALEAKIAQVAGTVSIVTGQNPYANLLDMVSMTTLTRMVLEGYWTQQTNGVAFEPLLQTMKGLERDVWAMADSVFRPDQQAELMGAITNWYTTHAGARRVLFVRPQEFSKDLVRSQASSKNADSGSVFAVVGLDPLSGLDPAVREVTESRLLAERALFSVQRMAMLLRWQMALLILDVQDQPRVVTALEDVTRVSESVERASRSVEALPKRLDEQRQAIVADLEKHEEKLTGLAAAIHGSLVAGTEMSDSLSITITNLNNLMRRLGVGEPTMVEGVKTNKKPFNIVEYGQTAEHIRAAAREVDAVVSNLNATLDSPAIDASVQAVSEVTTQATGDVRRLMNHLFLLAAGLVVLVFGCVLIIRLTGRRESAQ